MSTESKIKKYLNEKKDGNEMKKRDIKWVKDRYRDLKNNMDNLEKGIKENDGERIVTALSQLDNMIKFIKSNSGIGDFF